MNENNTELEKSDYLVIPIQMEKCEMVIRKSKKLSAIEKMTLKFILKDNSLSNLINSFNVNNLVMNCILAKLFYLGLIHLDLHKGAVLLSKKIISFVKEEKLDEFYGVETSVSKFPITIIQEKIGGEIFIEDIVKDYLKFPLPETTNFINLKASPPESLQNLQDYSLNKHIKCVRSKIRSEVENVEKINFIRSLYPDRLFIPIHKEDLNMFDLDFDVFPRSVQKYWQSAYESEIAESTEKKIDSYIENPELMSNKLFKIQIIKTIDKLTTTLGRLRFKDQNIDMHYFIEEELEDFKHLYDSFKARINSVNEILFLNKAADVTKSILDSIKKTQKFLIICSPHVNLENISFLQSIIKNTLDNVKIIFIWGGVEDISFNDQRDKLKAFKEKFFSGLDKTNKDRLDFTISGNMIDLNFLIIDSEILFYNNTPFMATNYEIEDRSLPTIYLRGGTTPLNFLQFIVDYLPFSFKQKKNLDNFLTAAGISLNKLITKDMKEILKPFEKGVEELNYNISIEFFDGILNSINKLKKMFQDVKDFESISLIYDYEHEDILIDLMSEIKEKYHLITDDISKDRMGMIFRSKLKEISNFSILLNNNKVENIKKWDLGVNNLVNIIKECKNCSYTTVKMNYKLNVITAGDALLILSNHRYLAPKLRSDFEYRAKRIGLIINSINIVEKFELFLENSK